MCGYVRRHVGPKTLREFLDLIGYQGYLDESDESKVEHFYPAWGGDSNKTIKGLLIQEDGELKLIDATWWYHGEEVNGELVLGEKKTFNARNLHISFWRDAIESWLAESAGR